MKKLYFLLLFCLLGTGGLRAQVTDSMRYQLDQVFAHVDKSQIPARLLDAYALPLVPLAPFNGVLQDSVLLQPGHAALPARYDGLGPHLRDTLPDVPA